MTDVSATVRALRLACQKMDAAAIAALVAEDAFLVEDGGGEVAVEAAPVLGAAEIARVLLAELAARELTVASINGSPGLVAREGGRVAAVACISVSGDLVSEVWLTLNPAKLVSWNRITVNPSQL